MAIKLSDIRQTKFQEMDDVGRNKFQGWCMATKWCKFARKSKDEYAHWDVSYYSGDTTIIIGEIKDRRETSTTYDDWLLEVDKFNELQKIKEKTRLRNPNAIVKIHYINFYVDEMMIWDITNLEIKKEDIIKVNLPETTADGNLTLRNKEVVYLHSNDAIVKTNG